ncbi:MAG: hypothetical protein BWY09_02262 [Candidatus Hydrogenedentes bacterium ADurb.Bin179]|nr:MAG: hypothetical protein BWY09_02262 [Candidatus Hydrogenedentes bacterium ADurb.Bin179]
MRWLRHQPFKLDFPGAALFDVIYRGRSNDVYCHNTGGGIGQSDGFAAKGFGVFREFIYASQCLRVEHAFRMLLIDYAHHNDFIKREGAFHVVVKYANGFFTIQHILGIRIHPYRRQWNAARPERRHCDTHAKKQGNKNHNADNHAGMRDADFCKPFSK